MRIIQLIRTVLVDRVIVMCLIAIVVDRCGHFALKAYEDVAFQNSNVGRALHFMAYVSLGVMMVSRVWMYAHSDDQNEQDGSTQEPR